MRTDHQSQLDRLLNQGVPRRLASCRNPIERKVILETQSVIPAHPSLSDLELEPLYLLGQLAREQLDMANDLDDAGYRCPQNCRLER